MQEVEAGQNFKAIIDYHFIDNYKIAAWRGRTEKIVNISIIGLEDPIYKKTITKQDWEIDRGPESFCNIEVSFPGGKWEEFDHDLSHTAIREVFLYTFYFSP